ncbi:MAG: HAMP domain-containing histidine kinase, partial [Myxococcales bacterium]|nr:HAMP domain-containing histidine kinase [Myxococcales bacterium]
GEQRLPRRWTHKPGEDTPAAKLMKALAPDGPELATDDPVWGKRLTLRAAFFKALRDGDPAAQSGAFRALLNHRLTYTLPADHDLPAFLALLDAFVAQGKPDRGTLRKLLADGLDDGHGNRLAGLQRHLLLRRAAFTRADFAALAAAVSRLSAEARAPVDRFEREAELGPAAVVAVPAALEALTLTPTGWVIDRDGPNAVRGVRVEPDALTAELSGEMRRRGLLGDADEVVLALATPAAVAALPAQVDSPDWAAASARADRALALKLGLLVLSGLLVLALLALALTAHRRRQRLLDLKDGFIRTVSHELRTPLASIRAMAETLERRLKDEPRARDYPTRIVRDVEGLGFLVENILSFNRLDHDRWVLRPEPVALGEVLAWAQDEVSRHAPRPVAWSVTGPAVTLSADPALLQLVCLNLGRNACHYNDRDPITLAWAVVRGPTGGITLTVTDNGRGIASEALPHVFTAFYRAAQPKGTRGSGLGLALCRQVMALHGGRIEVARTSPQGTTFALHFPPGAVQG